jgi:hypothetical protein
MRGFVLSPAAWLSLNGYTENLPAATGCYFILPARSTAKSSLLLTYNGNSFGRIGKGGVVFARQHIAVPAPMARLFFVDYMANRWFC